MVLKSGYIYIAPVHRFLIGPGIDNYGSELINAFAPNDKTQRALYKIDYTYSSVSDTIASINDLIKDDRVFVTCLKFATLFDCDIIFRQICTCLRNEIGALQQLEETRHALVESLFILPTTTAGEIPSVSTSSSDIPRQETQQQTQTFVYNIKPYTKKPDDNGVASHAGSSAITSQNVSVFMDSFFLLSQEQLQGIVKYIDAMEYNQRILMQNTPLSALYVKFAASMAVTSQSITQQSIATSTTITTAAATITATSSSTTTTTSSSTTTTTCSSKTTTTSSSTDISAPTTAAEPPNMDFYYWYNACSNFDSLALSKDRNYLSTVANTTSQQSLPDVASIVTTTTTHHRNTHAAMKQEATQTQLDPVFREYGLDVKENKMTNYLYNSILNDKVVVGSQLMHWLGYKGASYSMRRLNIAKILKRHRDIAYISEQVAGRTQYTFSIRMFEMLLSKMRKPEGCKILSLLSLIKFILGKHSVYEYPAVSK
ncbi:hypothetical protein DOLIC_00055 [Dolichomitus sp. PSUC_FEM 10030005]|nr:hypothetical protein [Dolichomitus sp. PSUC_FEM 10030005]